MKSIIKLLGLSIGCSCTALDAHQHDQVNRPEKDAIILATVIADEPSEAYQPLSSLQDIGKLYAL